MSCVKRHITYANVASTLALTLAVGLGGAYAVDRIGSPHIKDNSIRSVDLRDRKAVRGVDVKPNSLGRKQVNEKSLVATEIAPVARDAQLECHPATDFTACTEVDVNLPRRGHVLAIVTGSVVTEAEGVDGVTAECRFLRNELPASNSVFVGEVSDNTDLNQGDGFAHTFLSSGPPLPAGEHTIAFACKAVDGDMLIDNVSLVAVALTSR